jgi:hypothetical protein
MRNKIAADFKSSIQDCEFDLEDVRFAMDFDLGIIVADEVSLEEIATDQFLDQLIEDLDDDQLLEARDFFAHVFQGMYGN